MPAVLLFVNCVDEHLPKAIIINFNSYKNGLGVFLCWEPIEIGHLSFT